MGFALIIIDRDPGQDAAKTAQRGADDDAVAVDPKAANAAFARAL
jgi:hypothetical protein